jgi:drug/metabolite transporter (DMT)-like permease
MAIDLSPNLRGAFFMVIAMAGFTANDTIVKHLAQDMNMGQIMFVRGLLATVLITMLAWSRGALVAPRLLAHRAVSLRVLGELLATITFLAGLTHMPIANASAILAALPLAVTLGAALFFGESVGWRRWTAILVGFAGVLVIIRPGTEGFTGWSLSILGCVFFAAIRDLATRRVPREVPSLMLAVLTAPVVSLFGAAAIVPLGGWTPLTTNSALLLVLAAVLLLFGYAFIIFAMRIGEIAVVAPFRYTSLLWAIGLGYLVFADVPDGFMIAGSVIVVASGLYTLYREHQVSQQSPALKSTSAPGTAPDGL